MKKLPVMLSIAVLIGGIIVARTQAEEVEEAPIKYRSIFDISHSYCAIKTNGLIGQDNRFSAVEGRGFGTSSTAAMVALENGENEISIEFGGVNWFKADITDEKEKKQFHPDAGCKLEFVKIIDDYDIKKQGTITVYINDKGEPAAKEDDVVMTISKEKGVVSDFLPEFAFTPKDYPKDMPLYEFKKKVVVEGLPEWAWTKAEEYKDTPEQRAKLEQAYMALWQDFKHKDIGAIKQKMKVALHTWAYTTGTTSEDYLDDMEIIDKINRPDFKMLPINWTGYEVMVMNKGRFIRLVNKSDPEFSPITYGNDEHISTYAPIYSFINGEFVIVL